jgi:type IV pilus assembly protein PilY1
MKYLTTPYLILSLWAGLTSTSIAATIEETEQLPPGLLQNNAPPVVMLTMPRDHQLFFKAYSDYEDIDGDGIIETGFDPRVTYLGYFNSNKCYEYNTVSKWFEEKESAIVDKSYSKLINDTTHYAKYCDSTKQLWSGNFLNWGSMTRIDILRKAFYGGKRSKEDQPKNGVLLERSHIPGDAHSFAKYYGGADLRKVSPYDQTASLNCNDSENVGKDLTKCQSVQLGITLCNTTYNSATTTNTIIDGLNNDNEVSQNTQNRPLIRVARGNFSLWAANERFQCKFWESAELNKGGVLNMTDGLGNSANNAGVTSGGFNRLMADLFPTAASQPNFYFFHDSPSINIPTGTTNNYVNKYEPNYNNHSNKYSQKIADLQARVVVCPTNDTTKLTPAEIEELKQNRCKEYPISSTEKKYKPIGILQSDEPNIAKIHWGLITGSFAKNITGSALRKHVGPITPEIKSDGEFSDDKTGGLIPFLDNLRIVGWGYKPSVYNTEESKVSRSSYVGWEDCGKVENTDTFGKLSTLNDGQCVSWGNPLSTVLRDAYYYLSGSTTGPQRPTDNTYFTNSTASSALTALDWKDNPLASLSTGSQLKKCSPLEVVAINGSSVSYDSTVTDSGTKFSDFKPLTKEIGSIDLKDGNYFTSQALAGGTPVCNPAKGADIDLSAVSGTCPDAPALKGGYAMAGMAYKARTTPKFNPNFESGVRTSGVNLAMGEPKIEIKKNPSDSNSVIILPACRNTKVINGNPMGSCSIVDFKVISPFNGAAGKYLIVWEDAQQGSDFDQDATQVIDVSVTGTESNKVKVVTKVLSNSTDNILELGYTIAGVTGGGYKPVLTINKPNKDDISAPSTVEYTIEASANKLIPPPLFFAAKWGGFNDSSNTFTSVPNLNLTSSKWDIINNKTKAGGSDGIPDNYFDVVNPDDLEKAIKEIFKTTSPEVFAYAAIGSVNTLDDGTGISISSLYRPNLNVSPTAGSSQSIKWAGSLIAYARDGAGFLYEDIGAKKGEYDSGDKIISFETSLQAKGAPKTEVKRYSTSEDLANKKADESLTTSISQVNFATPLWSAEAQLARVNDPTTQIAYDGSRSDGRYIFTAIDANKDGLISGSEGNLAFDTLTGFKDATSSIWLDSAGNEADVVNYIRGKEISGYRSRRIDFLPDSTENNSVNGKEPWLLGDIVNSSPLVVGAPKAGYDRDYGDATYNTFREKYKNRRNVVYVGANDGMLHAFNVGKTNAETGDIKSLSAGQELWAYVPFNLLPHLKYLTKDNYAHKFYVDGRIKSYDVNIFSSSDTDHPGGWGTILIATMRTGGIPYPVNGQTLRSAIVVMDITNPEKAPKVLAELTIPDGSYTNSNPDIVKFR